MGSTESVLRESARRGLAAMSADYCDAMGTIITIAVIGLLTIGAIALGVKFFNVSVEEEEDHKGM